MSSKFKKTVRNAFLGELAVNKYHEIKGTIVPNFISDEKAINRQCVNHTGKKLNCDNPESFTEKMLCYKLQYRDPLMQQCADKLAVRKYVAEKGWEGILNNLLGVYDSVDEIDISSLPERFVLKASHGTAMNIIVKDKAAVNWKREKMKLKSWLKQDISWRGREWVYKDIPHRIIAEEYLEDKSGELLDYKIFCFNGKPKFVQTDIGRYQGKHIRNFYDIEWKYMPINDDVGSNPNVSIQKPENYELMLKIAESLAQPFPFVRVDFYEVAGKVVFGELTFFHNGGISYFDRDEWDKKIGSYWEWNKKDSVK